MRTEETTNRLTSGVGILNDSDITGVLDVACTYYEVDNLHVAVDIEYEDKDLYLRIYHIPMGERGVRVLDSVLLEEGEMDTITLRLTHNGEDFLKIRMNRRGEKKPYASGSMGYNGYSRVDVNGKPHLLTCNLVELRKRVVESKDRHVPVSDQPPIFKWLRRSD